MKKIKLVSFCFVFLAMSLYFTFLLAGCRPYDKLKVTYQGNMQTIGNTHEVYDYALIFVDNMPNGKGATFVPSDFAIKIAGEKILGQKFLIEEHIRTEFHEDTEPTIITEIRFNDYFTLEEASSASIKVYFERSLENVEIVFYHDDELRPN